MSNIEFRPVTELTYTEALKELETILRTMQSDNCDIDLLSVYTRRATELLTLCRNKLTTTEQELQSALAELENKN